MRLFIAPGFSAPVLERIREFQAFAIKRFGERGIKWVEPGNVHLTCAFLGEAADAKLPAIQKAMDMAARDLKKPDVVVGGFGAFPSLERPRVLWLGLKAGEEPLKTLAAGLYAGLAAEGFVLEREFSAHLTLARVKGRLEAAALASVAAKAGELEIRDSLGSLDLMESSLSSPGPKYRVIYSKKFI